MSCIRRALRAFRADLVKNFNKKELQRAANELLQRGISTETGHLVKNFNKLSCNELQNTFSML